MKFSRKQSTFRVAASVTLTFSSKEMRHATHLRYMSKTIFKADVPQMLKKGKSNNKINGKYWSSYVQWRNLLYWPLNLVDKIVGKTSFFFA